MAPKRNWKMTVSKYIALLKREIRVDRVMLFGSFAKGKARPHSDIDLAIFSRDFKDRDEMKNMQYLFQKTKDVDTSIEPHPYHPKDIKRARKGTLLYEIMRTGKVIL